MKKVIFFQGTFDILNAGHVRAFALAKSQGDVLVIGLNTDDIVYKERKRGPIIPFVQRREILEAVADVDLVIPATDIYALPFLKFLDASVYVLTDEWADRQAESIQWMYDRERIVVFSPRWSDILCSSEIRNRVREEEN